MKLEGIHHITAITADAQSNVDFYAGVLGLRLVKKTVNQDNPTVYHLFFADEKGSAGSDLTFFEFPGVPPGPGRRRRRAPDRLAGRLARRRSTSGRSGSPRTGSSRERAGDGLRFSDPEGLDHELLVVEVEDEPLIADHPEVPGRARAAGLPRRPRLQRRPRGEPRACSRRSSSSRSTSGWEARGEQRGGLYVYDEPRRRSARCRAPAASTTSPGPRRSTSTRSGASGRSRPAPSRPR